MKQIPRMAGTQIHTIYEAASDDAKSRVYSHTKRPVFSQIRQNLNYQILAALYSK